MQAEYRLALDHRVVGSIPPWFLSLTIDTSVLIGGRWWGESRGTKEGLSLDRVDPLDLGNPELARWAAPLAPAVVRLGGTEADRIRYGFRHDGMQTEPPREAFVLTGKLWERFNRWASDQGFQVLFTVSAGPESRDSDGRWSPKGAERLIRNTVRKGYPVVGWEFGNEVNAYPFLYGWRRSVTNRRYLEDFAVFADLVRRLAPGTKTVGPASAVWPLIGEPNPLLPALGRSPVSAFLDVMSFHFYPQQSSRGRVAVRRARETTLLNARSLDGALRWVRHGRKSLARGPAAKAPLWLTEAGHALYGGEPGLSDTWLSTPWWLDQLGLLAHAGVEAVFRQSLVGGDYGLLGEDFSPRPDYFASVLWKARMGPLVHPKPEVSGPDRRLRAWHHGRPDGTSCLLLVNLHRRRWASVTVPGDVRGVLVLEPEESLRSQTAVLNGVPLRGAAGLAAVQGCGAGPFVPGPVHLPPLGCAFVELSRAAPQEPLRLSRDS
jgi:heparanase 1